jgi:hypothetical protein
MMDGPGTETWQPGVLRQGCRLIGRHFRTMSLYLEGDRKARMRAAGGSEPGGGAFRGKSAESEDRDRHVKSKGGERRRGGPAAR